MSDAATLHWADNHCHLSSEIDDATSAVEAANAAGVSILIDVGCDLATTEIAIGHAEHFTGVYATAGVHPHEAKHGIDGLAELAVNPAVVAIGEAGLDYYYDHSPRQTQQDVFAAQIRLAHELDKPLVIHTRDAWDDTFAVLDSHAMPTRTVFHCFTGGPAEAEAALERGAMLSFSGIVTFKSAHALREAARSCPLDRLMIETDSPYLAPTPHRGKPNQPAWVSLVGEQIADLHGVAKQEVAATTMATTRRFYSLPTDGPYAE